ncbi:CPBP family intramembrane glutamic endopeptidase [Actinoalloteichus spitiensis]|uniref:CPBP family intramembrane glutamic endopeptidase n=1 Tax=Actinoalloteichus spitiensis TaxID=252394 RepID=UPI00037C251F|nr:CPBP family intramembrane glutamic endopeptidase [Actinoalloteichus spitiensis]
MPLEFLGYGARIGPGLLLVALCYWLTRSDRDPLLRIVLLILGFVLIRDAMTPAGFWTFGVVGGTVPWLRFTDDAAVLLVFGASTLLVTASVLRWAPDLRSLVRWGDLRPGTVALGLGGGVLAAAPVLLLSLAWPLEERGGHVAGTLLPALLFLALAGNLAEEVLFRGFLQGRLEQTFSPARSAVLSGVLFATCHVFLASTVTDVGWPLLAFTLLEGLICAYLRLRRGLAPAVLAHGTAIFLLASGLP